MTRALRDRSILIRKSCDVGVYVSCLFYLTVLPLLSCAYECERTKFFELSKVLKKDT